MQPISQRCGKIRKVSYSGEGQSDRERYEWAERETIRRLKEWIARRDERRRIVLAEQEHDVVVLDHERESTSA